MSECRHDWRRVGGEIPGAPRTALDQDAWCRKCGSLYTKSIMGWGTLVPLVDHSATTIGDVLAEASREGRLREWGRKLRVALELANRCIPRMYAETQDAVAAALALEEP